MSDERLPATTALIVGGIASGIHSGAQVCVSKDGVVLDDFAVGEVSPGLSMTPNSLTSWMSSGKPLLAVPQHYRQNGCQAVPQVTMSATPGSYR